jgi:hypothetical protein
MIVVLWARAVKSVRMGDTWCRSVCPNNFVRAGVQAEKRKFGVVRTMIRDIQLVVAQSIAKSTEHFYTKPFA